MQATGEHGILCFMGALLLSEWLKLRGVPGRCVLVCTTKLSARSKQLFIEPSGGTAKRSVNSEIAYSNQLAVESSIPGARLFTGKESTGSILQCSRMSGDTTGMD